MKKDGGPGTRVASQARRFDDCPRMERLDVAFANILFKSLASEGWVGKL